MKSFEVLLAEDDNSVRLVLSKALTRAGHKVRATDNPDTLLKWVKAGEGDIVLSDVVMGSRDVFDVIPDISQSRPDLPIIIISANNTVDTALKSGTHKVFEYIPKPFVLDNVLETISRAGKSASKSTVRKKATVQLPMIGRSEAMQPVFRAVSRYAQSRLPVLVRGDIGTGKDLVAKLLHAGGTTSDKPFLRMSDFSNVSLVLQMVNGGDIYIDEISSLSDAQQDNLLALMSEIDRIPQHNRPRVISATRKNLQRLVQEGLFRDDLLYRVNVAEIVLPTLAERKSDIKELAETFLLGQPNSDGRRFDDGAIATLSLHNWQGNVRELENLVRRLAVLYSDDVITSDMVNLELTARVTKEDAALERTLLGQAIETACSDLLHSDAKPVMGTNYQEALSWIEKPLIAQSLKMTAGNKAKAADLLGIHRNTLRTRLKALDINLKD